MNTQILTYLILFESITVIFIDQIVPLLASEGTFRMVLGFFRHEHFDGHIDDKILRLILCIFCGWSGNSSFFSKSWFLLVGIAISESQPNTTG